MSIWFHIVNFYKGKANHYLLPFLVFTGVFFTIIATINDYGLTWDEAYFIQSARYIEEWFGKAVSDSSFITYDSFEAYWKCWFDGEMAKIDNPQFFKLAAIFFRYIAGTALFDVIVYQYRVATAIWTALLITMLFMVIRKYSKSSIWALLGAASFISVPRFFADAHLFATDMIITSLGFAGLSVFMFASKSLTRILLGGMLFGAALASKFTGILAIAIVAPLIIISDDWKRFIREYFLMIITASIFLCIFNPPMLFYPLREIPYYFASFFGRAENMPISSIYFGTFYSFNYPLSEPWVMFGITLPPLLVITTIIGIFFGIVQFVRNRDRFAYFAVVPFLCLMTVYMMPITPKHDGIRLFSTAWPFIILLSIYGCRSLQGAFNNKFKVGMIICSISVLFSIWELREYYPHGLSYYNLFVGGAKGAQDKGLTVSYWYEAFNEDFFRQMSKIVGDRKARIYSWPNEEVVYNNQDYGLYPKGLRSVSENEEHEYVLVLNRYFYSDALSHIDGCTPLIELRTKDGAYIGGLYLNQKNNLQHPSVQ